MGSPSPSTIKTSCVLLQSVREFKKMPPEEALHQLWLYNAIGSCMSLDRLRHATGLDYIFK